MDEQPKDEPTQETSAGYTIPVPSREQVLRDFEKVAKAKPDKGSRRSRRPKEK